MRTFLVGLCLAGGSFLLSSSSYAAPATRSSSVCSAEDGRLPANVDLPTVYRARVSTMLQRSATFRDQCRRIAAAATRLRVRVRPNLSLTDTKSGHSITVFHRPAPGVIDAVVSLHPIADATLWLSHEFEHVIEQIENTNLAELSRRRKLGVWRSSEGAYETARAIRAGRAVVIELRDYRADERVAE